MRPLEEQTILITGATDGLGRRVAEDLAARGARIIVHGRSRERAETTVDAIRTATGNERVEPALADLASLAQVRELADDVRRRCARLDVLVSNAGIGTREPGDGARVQSEDGHELRFAVNYLAGFLLTHELLDLLRRSTPARIVHVASAGQMAIDFDDVMLERDYSGVRAYCQSKLAQIMFTFELAERLGDGAGVTVNALHPATYMPTKIVPSPISSLDDGVQATLRLVAEPSLDEVSGRYFNGERESDAHPQAYDPGARRQLRELSERLT
ncbi:MAG TPA: SDR family NAD(P)-dependent oxidoreductase, partial [Solirubrobacteraceae bacterium]